MQLSVGIEMAVCKHESSGFALKQRTMMALKVFTYVLVSRLLSDGSFTARFENIRAI